MRAPRDDVAARRAGADRRPGADEVDVWRADVRPSRQVLGEVLGGYLGLAPDAVELAVEPGGRPTLVAGDLRFGLSHTADLLVVAVTCGRGIGIDIERADRRVADAVLRRVLDADERAYVASLPVDRRDEAAIRLWTAKEAYVKAIGEGLAHPLDEVPVRGPLGAPSLLLSGWTLRRLDPAPGHVGALVVEGGRFTVRMRGWV